MKQASAVCFLRAAGKMRLKQLKTGAFRNTAGQLDLVRFKQSSLCNPVGGHTHESYGIVPRVRLKPGTRQIDQMDTDIIRQSTRTGKQKSTGSCIRGSAQILKKKTRTRQGTDQKVLPKISEIDESHVEHGGKVKQTKPLNTEEVTAILLEKELNATKIDIESPGIQNVVNKDINDNYDIDNNTNEYKEIHYNFLKQGNTVECDQSVPVEHSQVCEQNHTTMGKHQNMMTAIEPDSKTRTIHKCDVCDRICSTIGNLERHMYTHTAEKPFTCTVCSKGFIRKKRLTEHVNSAHRGLKPYSCNLCTKTFSMEHNMRAHINYHSMKYSYSCLRCNKQYKYRGDISKHVKRVHNEKLAFGKNAVELNEMVESRCGSSKQEQLEMSQLSNKTKSNTNECSWCLKIFSSGANLKRHMCLHRNTLPFTCSWCSEGFISNYSLSDHVESVHFKMKPSKCDMCEKVFATSHYLKEHEQTHLSGRNFQCTACGKQYKTKSYVRRMHAEKAHMILSAETVHAYKNDANISPVHSYNSETSVPLFVEEGKLRERDILRDLPVNITSGQVTEPSKHSFDHFGNLSVKNSGVSAQSSDLIQDEVLQSQKSSHKKFKKSHFKSRSCDFDQMEIDDSENRHENNPLATCTLDSQKSDSFKHIGKVTNILDSSFTESDEDSQEIKHTHRNSYRCETCDKSFSSKGNLKTHVLLHSNTKPYTCSVCSQGFTRKDRLTVHIYSVHTGYRPHSCQVCQKSFTTEEHLRNHLVCHAVDRPFMCTHCNKCFKAKSNLGKHVKRNHCP